ncbi:hypothetical protein O181_027686 [Austropuccinia psidii MF-1]|uniref:Uncharacterized protein n=1 Tax=Austropuccinia psidii MF-1 TaxID=1389203 RepID=A0A9Q3CSZ0_9BASI|nr:hypothetical protein [Austropuccinia psidii MF-1]
MGSKCQKQNPPNPPQIDSPVQCMPCKQTLWQPTPGPSGTRRSEDLFCKPSQHNEPPIPGPSPSSKPPEDVPTHEPEPQVAPTQSMEEPFACPPTPRSIIIIDNTPIRSPPPIPPSTPTLVPSSLHSNDDARQEFTDLRPTLMIPQAINQILLEHCCLLHMIPFVDAPGIRGGTKLPPWPGIGGLSKGGHHRDSLQILR